MKRQKFLQLTGLGAASLSLQPFSQRSRKGLIYSFPQMVGGISQTSAILQTRLTATNKWPDGSINKPEDLVSKDIPGKKGVGYFDISENNQFKGVERTPWQTAKADHDFIIKHKINNLKADTRYYMRVQFGPTQDQIRTGPISQFKTLPEKNSAKPISFVISSCMNLGLFFIGTNGTGDLGKRPKEPWRKSATGRDRKLGYRSLEAIEKLNPTFWVQTGDSVYYDHPGSQEKLDKYRAKTKQELRAKWHRQWAMPRAESLLRHVPTYWMVDDHDFRYNDSDNRYNQKPPSAELARKTFREQLPLAGDFQKEDDIYQTRFVNQDVQIWIMDGRFNRTNEYKSDGPGKTIWGKKQRDWLKKTLKESTATFKLMIVGTPFVGPSDAHWTDSHADYNGYRYERDLFFRWLKKHEIRNIYFITGDRHWQYHSIHPTGFEEFGTGTLTTQNSRYGRKPGDPKGTDPAGIITQPYIQDHPKGAFIEVKVDPSINSKPATLTLNQRDENGNVLNRVIKNDQNMEN